MFCVEDQIIKILGFAGQKVSATITELCSHKLSMAKECGCISKNFISKNPVIIEYNLVSYKLKLP